MSYYSEHKKERKEYGRKYRENHAREYNERSKQYYIDNRERLKKEARRKYWEKKRELKNTRKSFFPELISDEQFITNLDWILCYYNSFKRRYKT